MEELKNKVYELEGLLELATQRTDKRSALSPLIDNRISEIVKIWEEMQKSYGPEINWTEKPVVEGEMQESGRIREKLKLCLNDKFRFSRLLTKGNREEFEKVLSRLAEINEADDAREYLLSDFDLDPEDPEVMEFLDIITAYYA